MNKEFIRGLFPEGTIYASLLPQQAQDVIGKVGAQTRGVERMLRRVGFRYAERIDPFDGGPHFVAAADEISLVQNTFVAKVSEVRQVPTSKPRALVGRDLAQAPYFRAVCTNIEQQGKNVVLDQDSVKALEVETGAELFVLPLP